MFSELQVYISHFWINNSQLRLIKLELQDKLTILKKLHILIYEKSELWDKKSQLPFYSVAETGFHINIYFCVQWKK